MHPIGNGNVGTRSLDRAALLALPPADRMRDVCAYLRECYHRTTGQEAPADLDDSLYLESLQATELQLTVEAELEVSVPLTDLVAMPSLRVLAESVDHSLVSSAQAPLAETERELTLRPEPGSWGEPFGLTDVQHAYWLGRSGLFELGDVSTHVYLELESRDFDPERASQVLRRLVARHGMLRAVVRDDGRQQVLEDVGEVRVGFADLSGLPQTEADEAVAAARDRLSHEVRPAGRWPLFEVYAQRLPGGTTRVHLSIDMLIADAASVRILLSEWAELYADPDGELPAIDVSFRDYCLAVASGPDDDKARDYWLGRLDSLSAAPELPVVSQRPSGPTRFVRRTHELSDERWRSLKRAAQAWGVTPSALLCTAYAEALALWAKEPRFTLNVTIGDRLPLHPHVERLIGDFTNLVLLEVDTGSAGTFADRAQDVQRRLWQDLEHRAYGGVRLLRELARRHGPERAAMPVVFTSVLGQDMPGGSPADPLPGLGHVVSAVSQTPQVTLDCQVVEVAGGLLVSWDAVEALFPEGVLDGAFGAFVALVEELADGEKAWQSTCPVTTP
ncbi:condensation domain-containing protein, partial [Streptomyces sp. NPDC046881]|uniref:condensation domain-containing protein n=1 Tax=Streptomyces sp. NPDC046881 TaxID=3155374 RepID=UPI0034000852